MSWNYTPESPTSRDYVRTLCTDTDEQNPIFSDEQIALFLTLEDSNVRRAGAAALEAIARSEALLLKKIEVSNLKTDGPALAKELREAAKELRVQADDADAREDGGAWDWAEMVVNPFSERERMNNQLLRGI